MPEPFGGGPLAEGSLDAFRHWGVATAELAYTFLSVGARTLRESGSGVLIQITNGTARRPAPGSGAWSAGHAALRSLVGVKGWSFGTAILVVIAIGAGVGALNGWICHRFHLQSLIVTLATGSILAGALLVWTEGDVTGTAPAWLSRLTSPASTTLGIEFPPLVAIWLLLGLVVGLILRRTRPGRAMYHTGSNPRAADLALVRTRWVWVGAFAASGLGAALTGVLLAGFAGSANQNVGDPYLFESLAAVFVGGTAIIGARGDYWRTMLGALLLTLLTTVLVGKGYTTADQQIIFGLLVLLVVGIYGRDRRLRDRV